jgi:hypothetical protein
MEQAKLPRERHMNPRYFQPWFDLPTMTDYVLLVVPVLSSMVDYTLLAVPVLSSMVDYTLLVVPVPPSMVDYYILPVVPARPRMADCSYSD